MATGTVRCRPRLLALGKVAEISRLIKADDREKIMKDAKNGKISILVSSDNMARGIDLPNIKLVINYDPPKFARSYVHRVGRTARANKLGHSLTILKEGQSGTVLSPGSSASYGFSGSIFVMNP